MIISGRALITPLKIKATFSGRLIEFNKDYTQPPIDCRISKPKGNSPIFKYERPTRIRPGKIEIKNIEKGQLK